MVLSYRQRMIGVVSTHSGIDDLNTLQFLRQNLRVNAQVPSRRGRRIPKRHHDGIVRPQR
jgi:hypothetical protein